MIKRNNKQGFTLVELVIVIAVIAILAAVLIPTFSGIINKANQSADMQAVRQMNTALAADGAVNPTDIFGLFDVLDEMGMTAEDYHPLAKDTYFFWDAKANRVLYTDANKTVLYPEEFKGVTYSADCTWISLTLSIPTTAPDGYTSGAASVTVKDGSELAYIVEEINGGKAAKTLTIDLGGKAIDMMGGTLNMGDLNGNISADITFKNGTVINATAIDARQLGTKGDGDDGVYNVSGLFGGVAPGATLTIENVTIKNMNLKNTNASHVALLVGYVAGDSNLDNIAGGGSVVIKDVTIENSTAIGHRSVAALVGTCSDAGASVTLAGDITLKNVDVKTVGGRSGMLVGYMADANFTSTANITLENCSFGIYECEQNTGSAKVFKNSSATVAETFELGLSGNTLRSYAYSNSNDRNEYEERPYFANALTIEKSGNVDGSDNFTKDGGTVTGWN